MGRKLESYRVLIPYSEPGIREWLDKQRRPNMSVYMLIRQHLADTEEPMDVLETIKVSKARHRKSVEEVAKDSGFKVKKAVKKSAAPQNVEQVESEHRVLERKVETANNNTDDGASAMESLFNH